MIQTTVKTQTYQCQACDTMVSRPLARGQRPKWCDDCRRLSLQGARCSDCNTPVTRKSDGRCIACTGEARRTVCHLPTDHPVMRESRRQARVKACNPTPQTPRLWISGSCRWCGHTFTTVGRSAAYCSRYCERKSGRAVRRARERGAIGTYTWAEVTRKWIDNGKRCWYCSEPKTNVEIEPDHVVPLSRGGSNSIVNVVPSCGPCNRAKGCLLLSEWMTKRGLLAA